MTPNNLLYSEGVRLWPSRTRLGAGTHRCCGTTDFPRFFQNSAIVSVVTAVVVTTIASGAGYALSRFAFPGKFLIIGLMLVTQMFPLVMLIAPIFELFAPLHLTNSLTGLVVVYIAFNIPFAAFLMQSFFDGIPKDLEEAAMIDGDIRFGAFRKIALPLTLPGIAATLGFVFTAAWSELLFALMLISKTTRAPFPSGCSPRQQVLGRFRADDGGRRHRARPRLSLLHRHPDIPRAGAHRRRGQGLRERAMASIEISGVRKAYGAIRVLHGMDLTIGDGEFIVLVGPSGCGRSTLLRMIAGLEAITAGTIRIGGRIVTTCRRRIAISPWCPSPTRSIPI